MTDTATTGGAIEIAFPRQDSGSTALAIPTAPVTPANATIQAVVTGSSLDDARRVLRCSDLLVGETRQRAEQEAADLLPKMLDNTQVFLAYGTDSLTGVNALIDKLLREVEPTRIAEVTALMHDLNDGMREVKDKYDIADPKVREKFEHWKGGILRFLGHAKSMVEMLMEDVTSVDHQLDKVAEELRGRQYQLMRNVGFYDELYEENEVEIGKVIYAIAVMELIHDLALKQASEIKVGDASLGDRGGEQQAALAEFASNMAIKIAEYKGRLFVAWSTSPQVRTMRTLNVSLAERLNELVCVTIPTMKATIVQWRMLVQTQDAAKLSEQVAAASNEWLKAYAAAGAVVVPMVAQVAQTPTLQPQSIAAMAESIGQQAAGVIQAMQDGDQRRQEMDEAILQAKDVLDNSAQAVSDAVIKHVVDQANRPLEITTSVAA